MAKNKSRKVINRLFISKLKIVPQVHNFDETNMAHRRIRKGLDLPDKNERKKTEFLFWVE